jgi:predicted ATPase
MITSFNIKGFKCFETVEFELAPCTLLTGSNGTGKSSFIQALLLAALSEKGQSLIPLNGGVYGFSMGRAVDILRGGDIGLDVVSSKGKYACTMKGPDEAMALEVLTKTSVGSKVLGEIAYLQAERHGPRTAQDLDGESTGSVGVQGEFVGHVLAHKERLEVDPLRCWIDEREGQTARTLAKQVEAWMQQLVPGIEIRVQAFPDLDATSIRLRRIGQSTDWLRAPNIGFGLSYVLPIVVAGLVANPGSVFVVENPEAHLHPRGQSFIGRFLSRIAAADVQVIIETHSEHVLNGLRLAVVEDSEPITADRLKVLHFTMPGGKLNVDNIGITAKGGFTSDPVEFFDQTEQDLAALLKARRRG